MKRSEASGVLTLLSESISQKPGAPLRVIYFARPSGNLLEIPKL